jgi:hypothetical protein
MAVTIVNKEVDDYEFDEQKFGRLRLKTANNYSRGMRYEVFCYKPDDRLAIDNMIRRKAWGELWTFLLERELVEDYGTEKGQAANISPGLD